MDQTMKRMALRALMIAGLGLTCGVVAVSATPDDGAAGDAMDGSDGPATVAMLPVEGPCCFDDESCEMLTILQCATAGGTFAGTNLLCTPPTLGDEGMYLLRNHPDGNGAPPLYGLRLDELFDLHKGQDDIYTFDFEAPDARMTMQFLGDRIVIEGTAFGGLIVDGAYDPDYSSSVEIYFEYSLVESAPNDDDLMVPAPDVQNTGWIKWLETSQVIPLWDTAGAHPFSFRFGDMDDEQGHRDYDGFSGFGWLNHGVPDHHYYTSDWLFVGVEICDFEKITGACCINGQCIDTTFATCIEAGGQYHGDFSNCEDGISCTIFAPGDCREDLNHDRMVDVQDLLALLGDWGVCGSSCPCDLDRDQRVGVTDLLAVVGAWGSCD